MLTSLSLESLVNEQILEIRVPFPGGNTEWRQNVISSDKDFGSEYSCIPSVFDAVNVLV